MLLSIFASESFSSLFVLIFIEKAKSRNSTFEKLFLTNNIEEAKEITTKLNKYNIQRQAKEKEIFEQAISELEKEDLSKLNSIVLCGDDWHHGVIGIVASKIAEKFYMQNKSSAICGVF
jgi:single-stranded DNA-specific DHH superfamily exonuclease